MSDDLTPDELAIHALADNSLPPEEKKRVQALIDTNPRLQKQYRAIMAQKQLLMEWWFTDDSDKMAAPEKPKKKKEREPEIVRH